jgi:hypothetical protein
MKLYIPSLRIRLDCPSSLRDSLTIELAISISYIKVQAYNITRAYKCSYIYNIVYCSDYEIDSGFLFICDKD